MDASNLNDTTKSSETTDTVLHQQVPGADEGQGLVSDDLRQGFELVCYAVLNGVLGVLGSLANGINIAVFVKQGFEDSVNISFVGLAIADMCSLLVMIWESVCLNPLFLATETSVSYIDIHQLTSAIPHGIFVRTAWWITTFITLERCLCVAMPLKVKQVITPRRTVCIIVIIFIATFLGMSPLIISSPLQPTNLPLLNRTVLTRVYIENGVYIESIGFVCNVVSQFGAFIIDVICTLVIVYLLNSQLTWRRLSANISGSVLTKNSLPGRDKKVVKMVIVVSVVFIVCIMPSCVNFIVGLVLAPDYGLRGAQRNLFNVIWACILTLESLHSSVNIFVYYNMSTKFRITLSEMFRWSSL